MNQPASALTFGEFFLRNLGPLLAGIVIPGLVLAVLLAIRCSRGYYSAGLDVVGGLSGFDFGLLGLADLLRQRLSTPLREFAPILFVSLGLIALLSFVLLLPVEAALSRYTSSQAANTAGYSMPRAPFPYLRIFLTWLAVLTLLAFHLLLFFVELPK